MYSIPRVIIETMITMFSVLVVAVNFICDNEAIKAISFVGSDNAVSAIEVSKLLEEYKHIRDKKL